MYPSAEQPLSPFIARLIDTICHWFVNQAESHGFAVEHVGDESETQLVLAGDAEWRIFDDARQVVGQINRWSTDTDAAVRDEDAAAWHFELEHALPVAAPTSTQPLLLRTVIQLRPQAATERTGNHPAGDQALVVVRQIVRTPQEGARPQEIVLPPPSLVPQLIASFPVSSGGIRQSLGYWQITLDKVNALVRLIENSERTLPVVIVSPNPLGQPLVDLKALGAMLLGLAKVAMLDTPRAATEFGFRIPGQFRCFNGAVRVFDAPFAPQDNPARHRYWHPETIDRLGETFPSELWRHVIREAGNWIGPDSVVTDLPRDRLNRRLAAALAKVDGQDELSVLFEEISRSNDERIQQLQADLTARQEELRVKADQVFKLQARVAWLEAELHGNGIGPDGLEEPPAVEPATASSLYDAVLIAQRESDRAAIEFLPCALESAKGVQIPGPSDALAKLRAVCAVADDYHYNAGDGTSIQAAFDQRNIDYQPKVNSGIIGQLRDAYTREVRENGKRRTVLLGPHIRLTQRHRVYWYTDKQQRKFVVGHVGDHLPDSTTG